MKHIQRMRMRTTGAIRTKWQRKRSAPFPIGGRNITVDAILLRRTYRVAIKAASPAVARLETMSRSILEMSDAPAWLEKAARSSIEFIQSYAEEMDAMRVSCGHLVVNTNRLRHDYSRQIPGDYRLEHSQQQLQEEAPYLSFDWLRVFLDLYKSIRGVTSIRWHKIWDNFYLYVAERERLSSVNLLDVLIDVIRECRAMADAHEMMIVCEEAKLATTPDAFADARLVGMVGANILRNAIQHGARSSTVAIISASNAGMSMHGYAIKNRWTDMTTSDVDRVFERGYASFRPDNFEPTVGLGLFAARELVTLWGGNVDIISEPAEDNGLLATVTVLLPSTAPAKSDQSNRKKPARVGVPLSRARTARSRGNRPAGRPSARTLRTLTVDTKVLRLTLLMMLELADRSELPLTKLEHLLAGVPRARRPMTQVTWLRNMIDKSRRRAAYFNSKLRRISHDYLRKMSGLLVMETFHGLHNALVAANASQDSLEVLAEVSHHLRGLRRLLLLAWGNFNTQLDLTHENHREQLERMAQNALPMSLLDVVPDVAREYVALARADGVEIVCEEAGLAALPPVLAEEYCVDLITANLLCNATRYGAPSSTITLRAARSADGSYCGYVLENRGLGIPPAELPRVFERGYRCPCAAAVAPGAGLGLFVAKSLVELYGGRIEIVSTPVEANDFLTRVTVLLPIVGSQRRSSSS